MRYPLFLLSLAVLAGCAVEKPHDPVLAGTWEYSFLFLESADIPEGSPGWDYFLATPSNWKRVMGFKPVRTTYRPDGTFSAEYRTLQDSIITIATGTWHTTGDSLYFFQWTPDTFIATYQFALKDDTLSFHGIVDWERDGSRNDKITLKQVRWPRPDSLAAPAEEPRRAH